MVIGRRRKATGTHKEDLAALEPKRERAKVLRESLDGTPDVEGGGESWHLVSIG